MLAILVRYDFLMKRNDGLVLTVGGFFLLIEAWLFLLKWFLVKGWW